MQNKTFAVIGKYFEGYQLVMEDKSDQKRLKIHPQIADIMYDAMGPMGPLRVDCALYDKTPHEWREEMFPSVLKGLHDRAELLNQYEGIHKSLDAGGLKGHKAKCANFKKWVDDALLENVELMDGCLFIGY